MRIGVIYLGRRGSGGILALGLTQNLSNHADVFAVVSQQSEQFSEWEKSGLEFIGVDTFKTSYQALASLLFDKKIRLVAQKIQGLNPDILLFPMLHPWNYKIQRFLQTAPSVVMVHDAKPHPGLVDRLYAYLENLSIRKASHSIVFSNAMVPFVRKRNPAVERITVIPLPEFDYYHRFDPTNRLTPQAWKLLFFGRIEEYKGLGVLLRSYAELPAQHQIPLVIAGSGDLSPYHSVLTKIKNVHIENRWIADNEVPVFFTPNTIVILPYTSATQSGVIEIAASYALPVIASRAGGIPEQIEDCVTGLLVDPGDTAQLRNAMIKLIDDPIFAQGLGQNLQHVVEEKRSFKKISSFVYKALEQTL